MTILEPTLYANGALRLTDHGPRGGGLVLKQEGGLQVDIEYESPDVGSAIAPVIEREIESFVRGGYKPAEIIKRIGGMFERKPH